MSVWTTPAHTAGAWPSATYNAHVPDNLKFLYEGFGLWVPSPSMDVGSVCGSIAQGGYLVPVVPRDLITVSRLAYRNNTTQGQIDVGVYLHDDNDDADGGPTASVLTTSGLTAMAAGSGAKSVSFVVSAQLSPLRKYWLAIGFTVAGAAVNGTDGPMIGLTRRVTNIVPLPEKITLGTTIPTQASPALAALP